MTEKDSKRTEPGAGAVGHEAIAPLHKDVHDEIGRQLRKVYGGVLAEPLPEKFRKLLDELAKSERTR